MKKLSTKPKLITSLDQIPSFKDDAERLEWFESHELAPELFEEGPEVDAELDRALGITRTRKRGGK
jgi:hypothetical protein